VKKKEHVKRINDNRLELDIFFKVEEMHQCWYFACAKKKYYGSITMQHGRFQPGVVFKPYYIMKKIQSY